MSDPQIVQIISYDSSCGNVGAGWLEYWINQLDLTIADIEKQLDTGFVDPSDSYVIIYDLPVGDFSQPITFYCGLKQTKRHELQERCARDHTFGQF